LGTARLDALFDHTGLLAALIAAVIVASVTALGTTLSTTFVGIESDIAGS